MTFATPNPSAPLWRALLSLYYNTSPTAMTCTLRFYTQASLSVPVTLPTYRKRLMGPSLGHFSQEYQRKGCGMPFWVQWWIGADELRGSGTVYCAGSRVCNVLAEDVHSLVGVLIGTSNGAECDHGLEDGEEVREEQMVMREWTQEQEKGHKSLISYSRQLPL
ncbi:hypothetical protein M427DRAFT_49390 [Gonapodya prolifera JEL478]|uniref:Uncharacterized protein n=1 Tax=Gonapodya prolifera (strain JEL478) TaxID=1344416 RepID=A0A138ZYL6_GONPJ|nr:hypothetical protein M427DRAFT_49390 [Gonapodya prolifera JEL478]|eukprot:KXS09594.1 hypothetical protein M427DRAFT_49390 [Gonapodya prolifera JEL478]